MKRLVLWLDRYWERRSYNPVFAFAERLLVGAPLLIALLLMGVLEALGVSLDAPIITAILIVGVLGMFGMMGLSLYRWMTGYSRSEWQDKQAKQHRAKVEAAREKWRSIFKA